MATSAAWNNNRYPFSRCSTPPSPLSVKPIRPPPVAPSVILNLEGNFNWTTKNLAESFLCLWMLQENSLVNEAKKVSEVVMDRRFMFAADPPLFSHYWKSHVVDSFLICGGKNTDRLLRFVPALARSLSLSLSYSLYWLSLADELICEHLSKQFFPCVITVACIAYLQENVRSATYNGLNLYSTDARGVINVWNTGVCHSCQFYFPLSHPSECVCQSSLGLHMIILQACQNLFLHFEPSLLGGLRN